VARGRGRGAAVAPARGAAFPEIEAEIASWQLADDNPIPEVGNEVHRRMLESYARARARNRSITVAFGKEDSFTDMKGNITVASEVPPDGSPEDRYLAISGLLSHELWHERITAREVWQAFVRDMEEEQKEIADQRRALSDELYQFPNMAQVKALEPQLRDAWIEMLKSGASAEEDGLSKAESTKRAKAFDAAKKVVEGLEQTRTDLIEAERNGPNGTRFAEIEDELKDLVTRLVHQGHRKDMFNIIEDGRIEEHCRQQEPLEYRRISALNRVYPRLKDTYEFEGDESGEPKVLPCPDGYVPVDANGVALDTIQTPDGRTMVIIPPGTVLPTWTDRPLDPTRQIRAALLADAVPEFSVDGQPLHPDVKACLDECQPLIDAGVRGTTAECRDRAQEVYEVVRRHGLFPEVEFSEGGGGGGGQQQGEGGQSQGGSSGQGDDSQSGQGGRGAIDEWDDRGDSGGQGDSVSEPSGGGAEEGEDGGGLSEGSREEAEKKGTGRVDEGDDLDSEREKARKEMDQNASQSARDAKNAERKGDISSNKWQPPGNQDLVSEDTIRVSGSGRPTVPGRLARPGVAMSASFKSFMDRASAPERRQRAGRPEPKRFARAAVGETDLFKKPGQHVELDLAVSFLDDLSGSMNGQRDIERDAAIVSAVACQRLDIPFEVVGYDSSHEARHYVFKDYSHEGFGAIGEMSNMGNEAARAGGGTPTAEAIIGAIARIERRNESNKLIMVSTDGMPNDPERTRKAVQAAWRRGIMVLGMFICDAGDYGADQGRQGMRQIFGSGYIEVTSPADLPREFRKQVKPLLQGQLRGRSL